MRHFWAAGTIVAALLTSFAGAEEIGFIEAFSLAPDRTVPLKQLIPGTEDYYYYHALHYQNTEQWDKVEETLKAWIDRYKYTARVKEIQNRQALLTYEKQPAATLERVRSELNLQFNHQREELNPKSTLPLKLDPAIISTATLTQRAFNQYPNTVQGFEEAALDWLIREKLSPEQLRHLLSRLTRPDHPDLAKLVVDDLNHPNSGGFGQFPIHSQLLLSQLQEIVKLKPELLNQTNYVNTYLVRLRPSADANWTQDRAEMDAYLTRLWSFVQKLAPVHNSLKAHVLYHRLVFDRQQGVYDPARFMTYIKLPRQLGYVAPELLKIEENARNPVNLQADYSPITLLPVVGDDEPLVRSYLEHYFQEADNYKAYEPFIRDTYLKTVFVSTKVLYGLGNAEQWYSLLNPAEYQALKDRIEIDFAYTNRTEFGPDEAVGLDLLVKNVDTLLVKVFEVNAQNYYRENRREISTDINLDGLVANTVETHKYTEPSLRRVKRHFEFPKLNKRGVYIVDFIGNGISSRALIRKGKLHYIVRNGAAGQVFTILDEANNPVPTATLWLANTLYTPNKEGQLVVPYSNEPGNQPIVLNDGGFSSLSFFEQRAETYSLSAGIYVDREQLLSRRKATLLVRPRLMLADTPISLKALEDVRLVITSTDLDGIATTKEIPNFKLYEDRETLQEFQVPQRLTSIQFTLKGKVKNLSQNQKIDLAVSNNFVINQIDATDKIEDLHFLRAGDDYCIDLLGKTGEAQPGRPVQLVFKHRDFTDVIHAGLQTDASGRVTLGPLPNILTITATGPQGTSHTWTLPQDQHSQEQVVQAPVGGLIEIPYMGVAAEPDRDAISLLQLNGDQFSVDRFDDISFKDGLLNITKLPAGDYSLLLKRANRHIRLRLTDGAERLGYALGDYRKLQMVNIHPLQVTAPEVTNELVSFKLKNASPFARVHVFVTRMEPAFSAYGNLANIPVVEPFYMTTPRMESQYEAGRNIGDEYRYIIERQYAKKFPGNMLERPSLLLNPWAVRSTETGEQFAAEGSDFGGKQALQQQHGGGNASQQGGAGNQTDFANLDFLAETSLAMPNLVPDKNDVITIERKLLGPHQQIVLVAVDRENTASRNVTLPEVKPDYFDLRLHTSLALDQHFTQQKQVSILTAGETLTIPDITSARFEVYDSLAQVYGLYATLNPDPKLLEFSFILRWPTLAAAEKRELYSKYASHELNFFLFRKDKAFFDEAILPYLANKKDKTFVDRWLLNEDLKSYTEAWNYGQLNAFERVLLGQRMKAEYAATARSMQDNFNLIPPNIEQFNRLFGTALKGSALDTGDRFGLLEALEVASEMPKLAEAEMAASAPAPAAPPLGEAKSALGAAAKSATDAAAGEQVVQKAKGEGEYRKRQSEVLKKLRNGARRESDKVAPAEDESLDRDMLGREAVEQYYRQLDSTKEWAENNYYNLVIESQNASLITVNGFWNDAAQHKGDAPFYSTNLAEASRNFPEMLTALALLDLPFEAGDHKTVYEDSKMTLTSATPLVVFHEEVRPAKSVAETAPILVSQNFYRYGDRYRQVNNQQLDKFISEEFLVDTVYGCQIVVTNPTSTAKKLNVLLQIPVGALPVLNGQATKSVSLDLASYHTQTLDYYFYFPLAGDFDHYPVQVAENEEVLASAQPFKLHVVTELKNIDKQSWDYISQFGTPEDVLAYLQQENIFGVNLDRIAFRMADKEFFNKTLAILNQRHAYNNTLWSYAIKHDEADKIAQFLQFQDGFVSQCGDYLVSPLLNIDPVVRHTYQHLDYRPLVNPRVGKLTRQREILNHAFYSQYEHLLKILSYRRQLSDAETMSVVYYLLLQDRVDEALTFFAQVNPEQLATRLQYDYCSAYMDFYREQPDQAQAIAQKYVNYPVDRWKNAFVNVVNQVKEIEAPLAQVVDDEDRTQVQTGLASTTPSFNLNVEAKKIRLDYQNIKQARVNFYLMDIELLFSRNPFVQQHTQQFSYILPNLTKTIDLPAKVTSFELPIPAELQNSNVLVEVTAAGSTKSQAYFSNALVAQVIENYGQVRVVSAGKEAQPLAKVYVKVYARMKDGSVRFYKDGYTDLRGRFDYTSLNTNELDFVDKFSLLILSEDRGAVVREASPPKQ